MSLGLNSSNGIDAAQRRHVKHQTPAVLHPSRRQDGRIAGSSSSVIVVGGPVVAPTQERSGPLESSVRNRGMRDEEAGEGRVVGQGWVAGDADRNGGGEGKHKGGCSIF